MHSDPTAQQIDQAITDIGHDLNKIAANLLFLSQRYKTAQNPGGGNEHDSEFDSLVRQVLAAQQAQQTEQVLSSFVTQSATSPMLEPVSFKRPVT